MKHHYHFETHKPEPQIGAFWAILLIAAAGAVATILILATAGILI